MRTEFYAHGKLLLSGEYAVLDGARALAVPTRQGHWLRLSAAGGEYLDWVSRDAGGEAWFETRITAAELRRPFRGGPLPSGLRDRLLFLLQALCALQPGFTKTCVGTRVETLLEFPREWGLGSSSTLITNLSEWAGTDPYQLLEKTFGGSGYDLACARADGPIFYQRKDGGRPESERVAFRPGFAGNLLFVYLNTKQDSREGIRRFRAGGARPQGELEAISGLGLEMAGAPDLEAFRSAMDRHEALISGWLGIPPVKQRLFPDFDGSVKSLGAWGGDFVMAAGGTSAAGYFKSKGYEVCLTYPQLILA